MTFLAEKAAQVINQCGWLLIGSIKMIGTFENTSHFFSVYTFEVLNVGMSYQN